MWRFIHNVLIHPLIGIFGEREWVMRLHDYTGMKWKTSADGKESEM
jgi:hypothetical protein